MTWVIEACYEALEDAGLDGPHPCGLVRQLPQRPPGSAPRLFSKIGQHTEYVCKELPGMPEEEFVSMPEDGAFD